MARKIGIIVLLLSVGVWSLRADDTRKPAFQLEDNTFFDPTRKEEKKEVYSFKVEYRLEAGYVQHQQRADKISYPDMYLHGGRIGVTLTFVLPVHFSVQTGMLYTLVYGRTEQHWRSMDAPSVQTEYIDHRVLSHNLTIPVRMYYTIPLWRELSLFFYTGPQLHIGLAQTDYMRLNLSEGVKKWLEGEGIPTAPYDRLTDEVHRANIQWGVGGGLEWSRYRLQSGYDFGLNNLVRKQKTGQQRMSEWGWFVSVSYLF